MFFEKLEGKSCKKSYSKKNFRVLGPKKLKNIIKTLKTITGVILVILKNPEKMKKKRREFSRF
jgi:hypothetical protein